LCWIYFCTEKKDLGMVNFMKRSFWMAAFIALIAGCHPGGAEFVDELDIVFTTFDEDYNFGAAGTFALPDKIPVVTGNLADGEEPEFVDAAMAATILSTIRQNLVDRGFTEVDDDADIVIPIASISSTTLVWYCDYWWDYWYWWGYYPSYPGWGGCYYPSGYTYTTGSILITIVDGANEDFEPETALNSVWAAVINGLLQGNDASIEARVKQSIDQAFTQSPYLQSN
jgi:hypothetical protein